MKHLPSFLFIMLSFSTFSQESFHSYYVVVEKDKSIKPTLKTRKANNLLSLSFKSQDLQDFFSKRNVKNFQKAFPTAKSERLQRTYIVTIDGDLHSKKMSTFDDVKIAGLIHDEGGPLYQPNDYLESSGNPNRALELVHADEAFDITHGDPNILIGIVDTGFEITHDDLKNKIVHNYECSTDSEGILHCEPSNENSENNRQHGTIVAGAAAADTNNGIGVSSVGFNTKIVTARPLGDRQMLEISQVPGVGVINGSWYRRCSPYPTGTQQPVYQEIWDSGVVITNSDNDSLFMVDETLRYKPFESPIISSFPNPIQDQLSIKITNGEIHQVIIYDLYGRKVLKSRERKIDTSSLASGLYMIKIYSAHGVVTKKMIKS